jgi:hypothetical protein
MCLSSSFMVGGCRVYHKGHGLGERCDLADGALDTRVWVCVVLVTLLAALLCRAEWRVRLSLLLEPVLDLG